MLSRKNKEAKNDQFPPVGASLQQPISYVLTLDELHVARQRLLGLVGLGLGLGGLLLGSLLGEPAIFACFVPSFPRKLEEL